MIRIRIINLLVLLAVFSLVLSCGGKSGTEGDTDAEEGVEIMEDGEDMDGADQPADQEEDGEIVCECTSNEECDDGIYCNGEETCDGCLCRAGDPVDCSDGVDCTVDECIESTQSCQNIPNHELCGPDEMCDPDDGCVASSACTTDAECADDYFCNGNETCESETCISGDPPDCGDGVDCTNDVCVEISGGYECQHTPYHTACADTLYCTVNERCDESLGCVSDERDCGDGIDCTVDTCNESGGVCDHTPDDTLCADTLYCTVNERCDPTSGCLTDERDCGDGIDCTVDTCNESGGVCDHTPDDTLCADDLFCNGDEVCDVDSGCLPETNPCDDGLDCTDNVCNEGSDPHCSYPVMSGFCLIGGVCYNDGEANPDTACLVCDASANQSDWSVADGFCFIDGACYGDGDLNPDNECEICDPSGSQTSWTALNSDPPSGTIYECANGWGICLDGVCCFMDRPACMDGRDNDNDDLADWPEDPGCTDPLDTSEGGAISMLTECTDGLDNDGDTVADMLDSGCRSADDNHEGDPHPACNDGIDNDSDGLADYPNDPGCESLIDADESNDSPCAMCSDGIDNDSDGGTDYPADRGCSSDSDNDEWNPFFRLPECSDGIDNDGDTLVDYPDDPGCVTLTDRSEDDVFTFAPRCSDGIDNDCDGTIDIADWNCMGDWDDSERRDGPLVVPRCSDGCDNDGDGLTDFPDDPGCSSALDDEERNIITECIDGIDNDGDTLIDGFDLDCTSLMDNYEGRLAPDCSDGFDNDWDGLIDFGLDPQCTTAADPSEAI